MNRLIVRVGRHHQAGRGLGIDRVRHLFHAAHDHKIVKAARDGGIAHAQRGRARATSRLYLDGLNAPQAHKIGDQRTQVLLPGEQPREHIAYVQRIGLLDAGIFHGRQHCVGGQMPQRTIPVLCHLGLAQAYDADVSHKSILDSCLPPLFELARNAEIPNP